MNTCKLCGEDLVGESDKTQKIGVCCACRNKCAGLGVKTQGDHSEMRGRKNRLPATGSINDVRYYEAVDDAEDQQDKGVKR
jgi:hypothetical protein